MSNSPTTLTGLDGANPLAFLAALGALRVLDYRARQRGQALPQLSWIDDGCWRPVIHGMPSIDAIVGELLEDKGSWRDDPALLLAYDETGEKLVDPRAAKGTFSRDLKPKPSAMRAFLEILASGAVVEQPRRKRLLLRRSLDTAAAYGSEIVQDQTKGNTKPTAFHFTAGNQKFLKAVAELQAKVDIADLNEALGGPWQRGSTLPNMSWDATNSRLYALRARNPATDAKTTVAGADWLAFIGLAVVPSFPRGNDLATTGIKGGWKDSSFTWAVWERPATLRVVSSIVRIPALAALSPIARRAQSLAAVFSSGISRSDQGGYGAFAPAEVR
jgi:hypothetical protein